MPTANKPVTPNVASIPPKQPDLPDMSFVVATFGAKIWIVEPVLTPSFSARTWMKTLQASSNLPLIILFSKVKPAGHGVTGSIDNTAPSNSSGISTLMLISLPTAVSK